jgi:hypothetical protein
MQSNFTFALYSLTNIITVSGFTRRKAVFRSATKKANFANTLQNPRPKQRMKKKATPRKKAEPAKAESEFTILRRRLNEISCIVEELSDRLIIKDHVGEHYTTTQACLLYRISRKELFELEKRETLEPVRTGKRVLWAKNQLDQLFKKRA